ncbi:DMT family transporter [Bartonella sp. DGB2]|uniref:DMT family transporter n=1 Tax=Bartonella sp. DGB2 TaxID=3388426 RepID=UPI00398FC042
MASKKKLIHAQPSGNAFLGIMMKLLSVGCFSLMFIFLKAADGVPAGELSFFRSFFGLIPVFVWTVFQGNFLGAFYTRNIVGHVSRGLFGTIAMFLYFFALTFLPLPEVVAIGYGEPLILLALSAIILREKVRFYRWSAVFIGLAGVLIIAWPRLTLLGSDNLDNGVRLGVVAVLLSTILTAIAMILVRKLVFTEKTPTIIIYFMISSSVLSLLTVPFGWVKPDLYLVILLVVAGILGGVAQIFMTQAYRHAEASIVAPFDYTSIIWALLGGYFIFHETPTLHMVFGVVLVVASGMFIVGREAHLKRIKNKTIST